MRIALWSLLLVLLLGCDAAQPDEIDQIEIRVSGWSALDISLNRDDAGSYHISHPYPDGQRGIFSITPQQFESLLERLEPFRDEAVPFDEESIEEFINSSCPEGSPFVTDAGAIWIHWMGSDTDEHYLANLECYPERNSSRNETLHNIAESLPIARE